jgi:hypothetical protein
MTTYNLYGKSFKNFQKIADYYGVSRDLIYTRVLCYDWSLEEAIETVKHGKLTKSITSFDNNDFPSIKSAAAFYKLNVTTLSQRLNGKTSLTEEMVKPPKYRNNVKKAREKTGIKPPGYYSQSYFDKGNNKKITGFIYLALIPINGKKFIKVGITKHSDVKNRLSQLPKGSEIIFSISSILYKCWLVENSILKRRFIGEPDYLKIKNFHGYTELLSSNLDLIKPLKAFINGRLLHH